MTVCKYVLHVVDLMWELNSSLEQYDRIMNVNVRAIYQLTMLATPELVKTKGNVVNISSVNGIRSVSLHFRYSIHWHF